MKKSFCLFSIKILCCLFIFSLLLGGIFCLKVNADDKPNLIIKSLDMIHPTSSALITFTAVIKNIGSVTAGASSAKLAIGQETSIPNQYPVPELGPGEAYTIYRTVQLNDGNYRITADADVGKKVDESDEVGNTKNLDFTVDWAECSYHFDLTGNTLKELKELNSPRGVVVDGSGNIYVADYMNNCIKAFSPEFQLQGEIKLPQNGMGNLPYGLTVDSSGKIYVADGNCVKIYTHDGTLLREINQFNRASGVAVDGSGNIYVADSGSSRISIFKPDGQPLWQIEKTKGEFNCPGGIALDVNNNIYVADTGNNCIKAFRPDGTLLGKITQEMGQFKSPQGVAVDSSGNVYVADASNNCINVFEVGTGHMIGWITRESGQFAAPYGVTVDGNFNVYVADASNNCIKKFTVKIPCGKPDRVCTTACGTGTETWQDGQWVNCTAPQPQTEVCDGIDNNCDGKIDEGVTCGTGCDGQEPNRVCTTACGTGIETCQDGQWVNCTAPQPQTEVCDGIDNDCDGDIDEGVTDGSWIKIGESMDSIYAGGNELYAIDSGSVIYHYDGTSSSWTKIGEYGKMLAVDGSGQAYDQSRSGSIWKYDSKTNEGTQIGSDGKLLAVSHSGQLYGLTSDGGIYQYNGTPNDWTKIGSSGETIAAGGSDLLYGLTADGGVYQYNGTPNEWTKIAIDPAKSVIDPAKSIAVDCSGQLYGIGAEVPGTYVDGIVWRYNDDLNDWTQIADGGHAKSIVVGCSGQLYAITDEVPGSVPDGVVWQYNGKPNDWTKIAEGGAKMLAVDGSGQLYGLTQDGNVYRYDRSSVCTCTYTISSTSGSFPDAGGKGNIQVTTANDCSWESRSNCSWISIDSGDSGTGNGTVSFLVAANNGSTRTGTITIVGQTYTVSQISGGSNVPPWEPIEGQQYNMTVRGTAYVGQELAGVSDLIGAFGPGGEADCRAVAQIGVNGEYRLTVRGNTAEERITFKIQRFDNKQILDSLEDISFAPLGTIKDKTLHFNSYTQQEIELVKGWNWVSFRVLPDDTSLEAIFGESLELVEEVRTQTESTSYDQDHGWDGDNNLLSNIAKGVMFMIKTKEGVTLKVNGRSLDLDLPITLFDGWTWIAYLPPSCASVEEVVASILDGLSEVRSQTSSKDNESGTLDGDLDEMCPGKGYMVKMDKGKGRIFTYNHEEK